MEIGDLLDDQFRLMPTSVGQGDRHLGVGFEFEDLTLRAGDFELHIRAGHLLDGDRQGVDLSLLVIQNGPTDDQVFGLGDGLVVCRDEDDGCKAGLLAQ